MSDQPDEIEYVLRDEATVEIEIDLTSFNESLLAATEALDEFDRYWTIQHYCALASAERLEQEARWGTQNHPWVNPNITLHEYLGGIHTEEDAKLQVESQVATGTLTYADVLIEEVAEAIAARTAAEAIAELIQVAAVALAAAESIERNGR